MKSEEKSTKRIRRTNPRILLTRKGATVVMRIKGTGEADGIEQIDFPTKDEANEAMKRAVQWAFRQEAG